MKLSEPGVAGNRVYVGGFDGVLRGFGAPVQSPLAGGSLGFPNTTVGTSITLTDTFTANTAVTVTAVSASADPYSLGAPHAGVAHLAGGGSDLLVPGHLHPDHLRDRRGTPDRDHQRRKLRRGTQRDRSVFSRPAHRRHRRPSASKGRLSAVHGHRGRGLHQPGQPEPDLHRATTLPAAPFTVGGLPANGTNAGLRSVRQRVGLVFADRDGLLPRRAHPRQRHGRDRPPSTSPERPALRRSLDGQPGVPQLRIGPDRTVRANADLHGLQHRRHSA